MEQHKTVWILGTRGVRFRWPTYGDAWSFNGLHMMIPEAATVQPSAWFQVHRLEDLPKEDERHLEWLKRPHDFPIYMHNHYIDYPASVPLPVEELAKLWPFDSSPIFGSSPAWAVAMAIYKGYEHIKIRGIFLTTPREQTLEAPNFMLWVGIAAGRGIRVDVDGPLMTPTLYGYEPRRIPYWVDEEVVNDLVVDSFKESRALKSLWLYNRNQTDNPYDSVSFEDIK